MKKYSASDRMSVGHKLNYQHGIRDQENVYELVPTNLIAISN